MNAIVIDHPAKTNPNSFMKNGCGPRLVACSSVIRGKIIQLEKELGLPFVIGANQKCDFMIAGSTMSEFHVLVEESEGDWFISSIDEGAKVWVNNEPVQVAVLEDGDQVQLGRHLLVFLSGEADDASSDAIHIAKAKLRAR